MSLSMRWASAVAVTAVITLGSHIQAQQTLYPTAPLQRPQVMPPDRPAGGMTPNGQQMPYNTGMLGQTGNPNTPLPPGYSTYRPGTGRYSSPAPLVASPPATNPYALSTVPSYNPYTNPTGGMSNSPYSMSTAPMASAPMGGGFFPGYGFVPSSMGYGYALMGAADYTRAAGQYWKDIQSARITREESRQMEIETARRRIQFEAWYETVRPTAPKMRAAEMATELDRARRDPPDTEVVSGRALNVLLKSIQSTSSVNRGPTIPLEQESLKNINLTGGTSAGNVGMLKDGVSLTWPESLQEERFDEARKRLMRNLRTAVLTIKDREPIPLALRKDIQGDYKNINEKLSESADDMSPAQYIESRRFMNQLNNAIKALSDPKVANYFNNTWNAKGRTVAELVDHMTKEGLTFAPATQGDEAAYRALYQAMRSFEVGLRLTGQ